MDVAIALLAARQHGLVSIDQLLTLGLSREAVQRRVTAGRLHRVHQGVYAVGHMRLTQRGRWMAAVLAGGPNAVLSHRSAAALHGLLPPGVTHVTTPRRLRDRDGIRFHTRSLPFDEVTHPDGIPTTTVARALLDIAASEPRQFERAFNEAEYRRLTDATGIAELVDRYPRARGLACVRAVICDPADGHTREDLEHTFLELLDRHGIERPALNADLELEPGRWIRPDCMWREARLIVELDGRAAHATGSRFESDRERDRLLVLAGWRIVRITWRALATEPGRIARDVRRLLAIADG
jgi:hypothetical protein